MAGTLPTLIPLGELNQLKAASEVHDVATNAAEIQETQQVAYAINTAANTGATEVIYDGAISDNVQSTLETQGYILTERPLANGRQSYIISWV